MLLAVNTYSNYDYREWQEIQLLFRRWGVNKLSTAMFERVETSQRDDLSKVAPRMGRHYKELRALEGGSA
jgi:hypothetical protein